MFRSHIPRCHDNRTLPAKNINSHSILDILACAAKSSPNNVAEILSAEAKGIFCVGGVQIGLNREKDVVINLSRLLFAMELL